MSETIVLSDRMSSVPGWRSLQESNSSAFPLFKNMSSVQNPSVIPFNPGCFLFGIPVLDFFNPQCIGQYNPLTNHQSTIIYQLYSLIFPYVQGQHPI
jgi:hypothetical protein